MDTYKRRIKIKLPQMRRGLMGQKKVVFKCLQKSFDCVHVQ